MPYDAQTLLKPSVCPLDCPDTCSLSVETDGQRILDVRGSEANPYTGGAICSKAVSYTHLPIALEIVLHALETAS